MRTREDPYEFQVDEDLDTREWLGLPSASQLRALVAYLQRHNVKHEDVTEAVRRAQYTLAHEAAGQLEIMQELLDLADAMDAHYSEQRQRQ